MGCSASLTSSFSSFPNSARLWYAPISIGRRSSPEPGNYTFEVVDAFLDQLNGSEEVWVTVSSSSQATEQATDFLPPSPAKDLEAYDRFVRRLVQHCAGRVHYWQCDNEPSNVGLTWAGTADSYIAQLRVMHSAVKETDSRAAVVLGGAPYALPSSAPDSPERQFFDVLLREGREFFDLFDLHLYGQADLILPDIEAARGMMRAFGYEKALVVGEYNAPWPNLYPEATAAMEQAMAAAFATGSATGGDSGQNAIVDAVAPQRSPDEIAMESLYEQMASLPLQLQMFMRGCPPELEEKRYRINCRELVVRNLLALSAGVRRTVCWNLAPEIPGYQNPLSIMDLLFGKLALLDYEGTELRRRYPSAETFALLAGQLADVQSVNRVKVPAQPELFLFEVRRAGREPLLVVWAERDSFTREDEPSLTLDWIWPAAQAFAIDALGDAQAVELHDGRVSAQVSVTPLFITAD